MHGGVPVNASPDAMLPLCVDLDGTLVRTDTLVEGLLDLAGGLQFVALLRAFAGGRAAL